MSELVSAMSLECEMVGSCDVMVMTPNFFARNPRTRSAKKNSRESITTDFTHRRSYYKNLDRDSSESVIAFDY